MFVDRDRSDQGVTITIQATTHLSIRGNAGQALEFYQPVSGGPSQLSVGKAAVD